MWLDTFSFQQGAFSEIVSAKILWHLHCSPSHAQSVFIAESPAPRHQPGGDRHHAGLPAPGRHHGHHHLPHVPRHREDLQWAFYLLSCFETEYKTSPLLIHSVILVMIFCLFQLSSPSTAPWSTTMRPCDRNSGGIQQQMHSIYAIYMLLVVSSDVRWK